MNLRRYPVTERAVQGSDLPFLFMEEGRQCTLAAQSRRDCGSCARSAAGRTDDEAPSQHTRSAEVSGACEAPDTIDDQVESHH